jgi:hypothetical protein
MIFVTLVKAKFMTHTYGDTAVAREIGVVSSKEIAKLSQNLALNCHDCGGGRG